jgi:dGTPase
MYASPDKEREVSLEPWPGSDTHEYRTDWRIDYARVIHCPSFRRLQGKTQLFPGPESDFFRNRLTHSLEVAQISKSIAIRINHVTKSNHGSKKFIEPDVCEIAGLCHDLGHPPFGHQGEEALDMCMRNHGGFEGNAQTLRILSKIEKKVHSADSDFGINANQEDKRVGLNLTYRTLASVLKYDQVIPQSFKNRPTKFKGHPVKGYYVSETELVKKIKSKVTGANYRGKFKTVECKIMDVADDIAYSTYDLEDGLKAGFYDPVQIVFAEHRIIDSISKKISKVIGRKFGADEVREGLLKIFSSIFPSFVIKKIDKDVVAYLTGLAVNASKQVSENGFFRQALTSGLVDEFIKGVEFNYDSQFPAMSNVYLKEETRIKVELLKTFTFESQILSPKLKIAEYRGKEIVKTIFDTLKSKDGWMLLPSDYRELYSAVKKMDRTRVICDFIAGMTDRYALEFYGRLKSENPETIFKPL